MERLAERLESAADALSTVDRSLPAHGSSPGALGARDEGAPEWEFTIVTTAANDYLRRIHNRMPVVLDEAAQDAWLYPDEEDTAKLKQLLAPAPEKFLVATAVSKEVNKVRNDGPSLREGVSLDDSAY